MKTPPSEAQKRSQDPPVLGAPVPDADLAPSPAETDPELVRVAQLRSGYTTQDALPFPLGLGDYLSLLYYLDKQNHLIYEHGTASALALRRSWYLACGLALGAALHLHDTPLDRLVSGDVYVPREMMRAFRPQLREQHGVFQAVYYEIAIGGLLRQRADILKTGRSVVHLQGGPGSGITDVALRQRVTDTYFTIFDESVLEFSRQLLAVDALLGDLLPIKVGQAVPVGQLRSAFGYPDPTDPKWGDAF